LALAHAKCEVVINGREGKALQATAAELRTATGSKIIEVQADLATPDGQAALLQACPDPDILVNNNAGPPFRDFRQLTRGQMVDGVIANMVVAIELIQKVIDSMTARKFGRIVNITSGSVKMPLAGLDLSSGARAGLTAFLAGVARSVAASNVTINFLLPGTFDTEHLRSNIRQTPRTKASRSTRRRPTHLRAFGQALPANPTNSAPPVPSSAWPRLHHRAEPLDRWWGVPWRALKTEPCKRTRPAYAGPSHPLKFCQ
jgi:3-oxoacyl-[acyl-carrier protein] reductase